MVFIVLRIGWHLEHTLSQHMALYSYILLHACRVVFKSKLKSRLTTKRSKAKKKKEAMAKELAALEVNAAGQSALAGAGGLLSAMQAMDPKLLALIRASAHESRAIP